MSDLQICTFSIHERRFGVNILDVCEIYSNSHLRPVPQSPDCVAGLVNIRGQVQMIIDLRVLMGYPVEPSLHQGPQRLLLFKPHVADNFGLLIEGDQDIISIRQDSIVDRRANSDGQAPDGEDRRKTRSDLVQGVCMSVDPLLLVLRAEKLADAPKAFNGQEAKSSLEVKV